MKKFFVFFTVLFLFVGTAVFAGGHKQNNNQSAEYMKTLNRNHSTDADSVYFNPAGAAQMKDGLHLYLDYQLILQTQTLEGSGFANNFAPANGEFEIYKNAYYFGNFYLNWVKDNLGPGALSVQFGFAPVGGGGSGDYNNSAPSVEAQAGYYSGAGVGPTKLEFEGSSAFYGFQVNTAYAILEKMISFGAGYRFVYAHESYKGDIRYSAAGVGGGNIVEKVDTVRTGMCHGVIAGISAKPLQKLGESIGVLTIGVKMEWHSKLELEADGDNTLNPDVNGGLAGTPVGLGYGLAVTGGLIDGTKTDSTLPIQLSFGIGYEIIGINAAWSFNYFLNEETDWGDDGDIPNNYETGISVGYKLPMLPLDFAVGYLYSWNGKPDDARSPLNLNLDTHSISFGLSYLFIERIKLTVAYTFNYYVPVEDWEEGQTSYNTLKGISAADVGKVEASQMNHAIAIGVEAKVL
jgi:hypothetical protein